MIKTTNQYIDESFVDDPQDITHYSAVTNYTIFLWGWAGGILQEYLKIA